MLNYLDWNLFVDHRIHRDIELFVVDIRVKARRNVEPSFDEHRKLS